MTPRTRPVALALALMLSATALADGRAEQAKPAADTVTVTVKYSGKGTVDAEHRLWVWLFTTPEIGPGAQPIAEQSVAKNGVPITFTGVTAKPVYIAAAYDEKGGFGGNAPPPSGSPIGLYGAKTEKDKPQPVTPGAKAVAIAITDAIRMP